MHRHLSAISKRLKTIAKIFAAAGAALISLHNISIFAKDFPLSSGILHEMLTDEWSYVLRLPPGLNSLTPTIYGNAMVTMFISVIDNQNHIHI